MSKWSLLFSSEMCLKNTKSLGYIAFSLIMIIAGLEYQNSEASKLQTESDSFIVYFMFVFAATSLLMNILVIFNENRAISVENRNAEFKLTVDTIFQFVAFAISLLLMGLYISAYLNNAMPFNIISLEFLSFIFLSLASIMGMVGFAKLIPAMKKVRQK